MIKINLLRSLGMSSAPIADGELSAINVNQQASIKGLMILLFPLLVIGWEKINISFIRSEGESLEQQISKIEQEKASFGDVSPRVEKFTKERDKIEAEVETIRELTGNRLREVKTLDQLQSLVPSGAWLRKVSIKGLEVTLEGFTRYERGVPEFISILEKSAFFTNIRPGDTSRIDVGNAQALKFTLGFEIAKGPSGANTTNSNFKGKVDLAPAEGVKSQ